MNDLLSQLPEYDPRPDLWSRIEADLDADKRLEVGIRELPHYEPKTDLWEQIESDISKTLPVKTDGNQSKVDNAPQKPFVVVRSLWAGVAAAAMVVLIGVWLLIQSASTEQVRVEYAVEANAPSPSLSAAPSMSDKRAEEFITHQCAEQQLVCQRPEVHELRNQLTELTAEQQRIEQERETFGDDPALIRAQVKVENQRAEVTKELITLLRS